MRTTEEIKARIRERQDNFSLTNTEISDLLARLEFIDAMEWLKPLAKMENWNVSPRDRESIIKEMREYMPFAWEKANDFRGLSAMRSMEHFSAWVWLAGDNLGELRDYEFYGKDNLVKICKHYGFDHSQWDDGIRRNEE